MRTAPRGAEHFCWRIDIRPRLGTAAGLELGTGIDLNPVSPERAARELRERVIAVALVILASVGIGAGAERRWGEGARRAGRRALDILIYVLMPFVTFFTVTHVKVTTGVGAGLAFGFAERGVATLAGVPHRHARAAPRAAERRGDDGLRGHREHGLPRRPARPHALRRPQAVGQAITYDVVVSATFLLLVGFAIGAAFGTLAGETPRERLRAFVTRNPPLLAFLLALVAPSRLEPGLGARRRRGRGARVRAARLLRARREPHAGAGGRGARLPAAADGAGRGDARAAAARRAGRDGACCR